MNLFEKIREGLTKTRDQLLTRIEWAVKGRPISEEAFDAIEEAIILSDAGLETTEYLIRELKEKWKRGQIKTSDDIERSIMDEVEKILLPVEKEVDTNTHKPFVILTIGVNGVGKTTTIAKLAHFFKKAQKKVLLGACDTFRAAAIEQLEVWAKRVNADIIKHSQGSDPAAVAFDAVKAARARDINVLILDTAGRLHTKSNLMEEMKKIKRVIGKEIDGAPHETLLVVDATNGQNAIVQAKTFHDALHINGIIATKLDGTAKGGFILPIAHTLKIPIRFLGIGEKIDDLVPFQAHAFSRALFHSKD